MQAYPAMVAAPAAQAYSMAAQAMPAHVSMTTAPQPPTMDRMLMGDSIMIKQLNSECCRFFCCQPNIHFTMHPYDHRANASFDSVGPGMVWIQEDASWCGRTMSCLSPGHRGTTYRTLQGPGNESAPVAKDSESMLTHSKGCTNGVMQCVGCTDNGLVYVPCCCNLPYLDTKDATGRKVGRTQYLCDAALFVPKFEVQDEAGRRQYMIRPDTCCLGLCIQCRCEGSKAKACHVPYRIRDPISMQPLGDAVIEDLWAGLAAECCTHKNLVGVKFPVNATLQQKQTLIGSALLIEMALTEQQG